MSKQTLHFTVGSDAGVLLMNIAQEHLIYNFDHEKALATITESLMGCPVDLALKILKGDYVLPVDVDSQQFMCCPREEADSPEMFPQIKAKELFVRESKKIIQSGEYLLTGFKNLQDEMRKGTFRFDFEYEDIFKFIAGNDDAILDALRDDIRVEAIDSLFYTTKKFIERTDKFRTAFEWMYKTWSATDSSLTQDLYEDIREGCTDIVLDLAQAMQSTIRNDFPMELVENVEVANYIESMQENDIIISRGIEPVNILDGYSAGWLAPDGEFYGLNGEYANMLHIQIADALMEQGIIPVDDINPDSWLEQHGWVKIHGQFIHFAGCLNEKLDKPNVGMSPIQIKTIYEYGMLVHNGMLKVGWKQLPMNAVRFRDTLEDNPNALDKNYFKYD
jgi:hypothetical protein